jgi:PAS domain S-box-containing protein
MTLKPAAPDGPRPSSTTGQVARIVGSYVGLSAIWIALSNTLITRYFGEPHPAFVWDVAEDLAFVVVTGVVLWIVLTRHVGGLLRVWESARAAEEALEGSEDQVRILFDHAPDIMLIHDVEGRITDVNRAACERLGYRRDELLEMLPMDLEPSGQAGGPGGADGRLYQTSFLRRDGTAFPVEVSSSGIRYGGRPVILSVARDTSERKRVEEAVRDGALRLQTAVRAANVGLWDWNFQTERVFYSPEWKRQIGYQDHEIGNDFTEWEARVHPDDLPHMQRVVRQFIAEPRDGFEHQFRFRHRDGSYRWILAQAALIRDASGKPWRLLGSHVDITSSRLAEQAALDSAQRLRLMLESAGAGTWEWTPDTGETVWSEEIWALGDLPRDTPPSFEAAMKTVHPDDAARVEREIEQARAAERDFEVEWRVRRTGGAVRWVLLRGRRLDRPDGAPLRYTGIALDITERRESEARARRWEQLFARAQFGLAHVSAADNCFLEVNAAYARERGYAPEALVGLPLLTVYPPSEQAPMTRRLAEIDSSGHLVFESLHQRKDGTTFPVLMEVTAIKDASGQVVSRVSYALDITELKARDAQVQQTEAKYRTLFEEATEGVVIADAETGVMLDSNRAFTAISGYSRDEIVGRPQSMLHPPEPTGTGLSETFRLHLRERHGEILTTELLTASGERRQVEIKANSLVLNGRRVLQGFFRDVTSVLQYEHDREATIRLLQILNEPSDTGGLARRLSAYLCDLTGCSSVGLRLRDGTDFPYFETRGFPAGFIARETHLCQVAGEGPLACLCGAVLEDRLDRTLSCCTRKGSFWTNQAAVQMADGVARIVSLQRDHCWQSGFQSVALVQMRHGGTPVGLIQLNDAEPDRFTPELIDFLERAADQVAIAVLQRQGQEALQAREERIERLNQVLRAIRDVNVLMVRERRPDRLLEDACRILVEGRGYLVVWIGVPNSASTVLVPAAAAGERVDYVEGIQVSLFEDQVTGRGPSGTAFRTRRACVTLDTASDAAFSPWREAATSRGLRSSAAVPMLHGDRVMGVLQVYADRPNVFDHDEVELLSELANDLAFALRSIEHEAERAATEEQVRAQAKLLDLAQDAIIVRGLDDRVRYWNRGAAALYGWGEDEAIGQLAAAVGCPATPQFRAARERLLETGSWTGELAQVTKGGRALSVSSRWTAVRDDEGQVRSVLVIDTDITEKKQLEAQFIRAQRVESIGQLAGGVAHDYNNILAAAMLQLEILRQTPDLPQDVAAGLEELDRQNHRAASLTRQLLLLSRRQAMQIRRLDLGQAVAGVTQMLARLVGEHIEMSLHEPSSPCWVEGDAGMLEQVVMNLCLNARDAMPKGGRLRLDVQGCEVRAAEARRHPDARVGAFVCLRVSDTGSGMDEVTLKRIFEPFFTTKEPGRGTGLGLATVYGIVRQHRGWVEVESSPGIGTRFEVFLPAAPQEPPAEAADPSDEVGGGGETVLVVEDEASVRRLAAATLRRFGYTVLEAGNGVEALRVWEERGGAVDLLVSDMVMPEGLTGIDLADRLREISPRLQVVITSGYSAELTDLQGRLPEGVSFLGKPYTTAVLGRAVREALDRRR